MSNIVPDAGQPEETVAITGGHTVSMQLVQQIYKEVTGKTERISRQFDVNHRTDFSDLENLNSKVEQLLEQYHVKEKNCIVSFFHADDCSERFSSFDRAQVYESGSASPIETVQIEYEFLIVLPIAKKPQSYKITVDIHSRAAMVDKLKEGSVIQRRLYSAFSSGTGSITIEYIDYAVARTMMTAVAQWFESLDQSPTPAVLKWLKKIGHHLPWIARYATATIVALLFLKAFPVDAVYQIDLIGRYALIAFSAVFVISGIAFHLANILEDVLAEAVPLSYLNLNRGDKKAIEKMSKSHRFGMAKAAASIGLTIALNIFAAWLATKMGIPSS